MLKSYKLLGVLATGGMAQLLLARNEAPGAGRQLVAIKRIIPALAGDAHSVVRFLDEARIAIPLDHPNIVRAQDADIVDGQVFLAMEYLHGKNSRSVWKRARSRRVRLPLENAIGIVVAVAAGLSHAHDLCGADGRPLHIVHRDVSPHNIIVTYDGQVKIIDFGIAKAVTNLCRTRLGTFAGKYAYASPEQVRCEPVDRRTDIFSLGIVLFELSTGARAFPQPNDFSVIQAIAHDELPQPSQVDPAYPPALERIVMRALAREKSERYQTADELRRDLEAFARANGLDLSRASLARLMAYLFRDEPALLDHQPASENAGWPVEASLSGSTQTLADLAGACIASTATAEAHEPATSGPPPRRARASARLPAVGAAAAGLLATWLVAAWLDLVSSDRHAPMAEPSPAIPARATAEPPAPRADAALDRAAAPALAVSAVVIQEASPPEPRRSRRKQASRRHARGRQSQSSPARRRPTRAVAEPAPPPVAEPAPPPAKLDESALDKVVPR
jgi:serine/threonine protein kinase